jgi:hypothetical protein
LWWVGHNSEGHSSVKICSYRRIGYHLN